MFDRRAGEAVVIELTHSPGIYKRRYLFPFGYVWAYPKAACAALLEAMPWEALAVSGAMSILAWFSLGHDLGVAAGMSVTLALVTLQMLRTRTFVTASRIVQQRGLFGTSRCEIPLASIHEGRVVYPTETLASFGDIVLVTTAGEKRLRAVPDPDTVLKQLLALRGVHEGRQNQLQRTGAA
jgi:hypothetical protein